MQTPISCLFMRGGTSRGPFFNAADLPADIALRDRVLLAVMGSPDRRQIDGLGGANPLTSKVGIVSPSKTPFCATDCGGKTTMPLPPLVTVTVAPVSSVTVTTPPALSVMTTEPGPTEMV